MNYNNTLNANYVSNSQRYNFFCTHLLCFCSISDDAYKFENKYPSISPPPNNFLITPLLVIVASRNDLFLAFFFFLICFAPNRVCALISLKKS